jgi:hypothetical protein
VTIFPGRDKNFIKNHWIAKQKRMESISRSLMIQEQLLSDSPILVPTRPDSFRTFDGLFQEKEKEDIFCQTMMSGCFEAIKHHSSGFA